MEILVLVLTPAFAFVTLFLVMKSDYDCSGRFKRLFHDVLKIHSFGKPIRPYKVGNRLYIKCKYCDKKDKIAEFIKEE